MHITILCVGKVKEKFFRDALDEYAKRLSRYCKFDVVEVADEKTPDMASAAEEEQIKKKEAERLLAKIKPGSFVLTLEIGGKEYDSVAFSEFLSQKMLDGASDFVFIIGGSLGLHKSVTDISNAHISFSKMTFPHQLMRVILAEQIYRSFRISANEPYHK